MPTAPNAVVMTQGSVAPFPASALIVSRTGLYEAGWSAAAATKPPMRRAGAAPAATTAHQATGLD
ncbi:MAG: hypothetical protein WCF24_03190 [Acidimicrobiales bacterium]